MNDDSDDDNDDDDDNEDDKDVIGIDGYFNSPPQAGAAGRELLRLLPPTYRSLS